MKKLIFLILFAALYASPVLATSLDAIYRDLVKSDNQGYLPLFVKNRKAPDILNDEQITNIPPVEEAQEPKVVPYQIPLVDKYKIAKEAELERLRRWDNAVKAVQENRVTPLELDEILRYVAVNNPKAVEIYAWMTARGVGVKQDLVKAFNLYQQAIFLQVPNAEKNAAIVYRDLTPEQRQQIKAYIPPQKDDPVEFDD